MKTKTANQMNKVLIFIVIILLTFVACKKNVQDTYIKPLKVISACGCDDPLNQLKWLNELANKSLLDKTGNYIGNIWVITINNSDIIVTDMGLSSGGILYHYFDCQGNKVSNLDGLQPIEVSNRLTTSNKIYSSCPTCD